MEELSRSHTLSCDDLRHLFSELFENINAKTETGESPIKDSEPKTGAT